VRLFKTPIKSSWVIYAPLLDSTRSVVALHELATNAVKHGALSMSIVTAASMVWQNPSRIAFRSKKAGNQIADGAIAGFEKAETLGTRRTPNFKVGQQLGLTPEQPGTIGDALIQAEIRSHLGALRPGDRMAFIDAHATEIAAAVLAAPSFLSGLTRAELDIVKQRNEARANPEIAKAMAENGKGAARDRSRLARRSGRSAIAVVWGDPTMEWCERHSGRCGLGAP
jgi:hypothetical protein